MKSKHLVVLTFNETENAWPVVSLNDFCVSSRPLGVLAGTTAKPLTAPWHAMVSECSQNAVHSHLCNLQM